ncbi:methyltransferase domain-containing protein [Actinomadura parmotrematis]|uniref:Protein-L-isoaspartate O-methyltransferase n=1 Tax=Actinomadura parmotrematis TaxID=2864039 RepID=A0ABS7FTC0_9ACTN|nr:methyltransferase domain-containing protein [Actinomadura parmotrematis]MBW8483622.1 methyltransferase domain-containing protein [Actinomadura parmotrematis]
MDPQDRIGRLADGLAAAGRLTDPRWRDGLRAVPRHLFAPERAWAVPDRPRAAGVAIDRVEAPVAWWDMVYADAAIAVQVDDGRGDPAERAGTWTSSLSAPGIVLPFLEALGALDHHRVLEVGTGTGWTAGLLAWRVGAPNVTSVEVDAALSERAAANLEAAGLAPRLVVGDGAEGHPDGAPYDRVHVTCGVERVPAAWVRQCRPGAVIVLPWSPGWGVGHLARLVVGDGAAVGRLTGPAGFMMMRAQRRPFGPPGGAGPVAESATRIDPRTLVGASPGADLMVNARVPGVRTHLESAQDGTVRVWAVLDGSPDGTAWATADFVPGSREFTVRQAGPRRLWDEIEAAYLDWVALGQPGRDRFGLAVDGGGQRVWLDRPDAAP